MRGIYTATNVVSFSATSSGLPIFGIIPKVGGMVELIEFHATNQNQTTNQQLGIQGYKSTTSGFTGMLALSNTPTEPGDQASTALTFGWQSGASIPAVNASFWQEGFSLLPGFHYTPTRDGREYATGGTGTTDINMITFSIVTLPTVFNLAITAVWRELG